MDSLLGDRTPLVLYRPLYSIVIDAWVHYSAHGLSFEYALFLCRFGGASIQELSDEVRYYGNKDDFPTHTREKGFAIDNPHVFTVQCPLTTGH